MTDAPQNEAAGPDAGARIAREMRLRPERPRVTRLSRKVLRASAPSPRSAIGGALFFALQPHRQTAGSELYNTDNRSTPDGLAGLPATIPACRGTSPQLGPPLPGDLGRPILNAGAPAPGMPTPAAAPDPEEQRLAQEREAARTSHLFATTNTRQIAAVGRTRTHCRSPTATAAPAIAGSSDLAAQDHKLAFLNGDGRPPHRQPRSRRRRRRAPTSCRPAPSSPPR